MMGIGRMQMMKSLVLATVMSLTTTAIAQAENFEMTTYPAIAEAFDEPLCPEKVTGSEKGRPYTEGSYTNDGTVNLTAIATDIEFESSRRFSVTWKGKLKPQYQKCIGSSKITAVGNEFFDRHSHLKVQYDQGQVFFTVDMTGISDANGFTTILTEQNIVNGNPTWSWSGSD